MILGFNARRIGDMLTKAGRAKKSRHDYFQARAWFNRASVTLAKESKESQWIAAETAKLL